MHDLPAIWWIGMGLAIGMTLVLVAVLWLSDRRK